MDATLPVVSACLCLLSGLQTWKAFPFSSMTMVVFFWSWKGSTHHYGREYLRNKSSFGLTLSLDSQYFIAINYERNVCIFSLKTPNLWSVMNVYGVIRLSSNPVTTRMRKGKGSSPSKHCASKAEKNPTQELNHLTHLIRLWAFQASEHTYMQTERYIWFDEEFIF